MLCTVHISTDTHSVNCVCEYKKLTVFIIFALCHELGVSSTLDCEGQISELETILNSQVTLIMFQKLIFPAVNMFMSKEGK